MGSTVKIGVMTISSSKCDQTATDDGHDARPEKQSYERQIVIFFWPNDDFYQQRRQGLHLALKVNAHL